MSNKKSLRERQSAAVNPPRQYDLLINGADQHFKTDYNMTV